MSGNTSGQPTVQGSETSFAAATSTSSIPTPQCQTPSKCDELLLVLLVSSWIVTAILLIFTIGMAMYICKTRRSVRLPLTAVKVVGVRLPAYDQRTGGGTGDVARRQPNGVRTLASVDDEAPSPTATMCRVDLHYGGCVDGATFRGVKQPTGVEQLCGRRRSPTEGAEGLTQPTNAASASPAQTRRPAELQLSASTSPNLLRPSALCPPAYAAPGATGRAASPVRGLAPPPSPLAIPVPVSPTAAGSLQRPVARAAATPERTLAPCAAISARGGGDGDDGNMGAGRCYNGAIGIQSFDLGGSQCNVASGAAGSAVDEQASRAVPASSTAYGKAMPLAAPKIRRKSRFRAAAELCRLSDSLLDECRWDVRRSDACDVDASLYIAVLPSPPQPRASRSSDDGDDYENAGPVTQFEYIQGPAPPLPQRPAYKNGRAVAAGDQRPSPQPRRRRSLESGIEDYDYCNENATTELFRIRRA